MSQTPSDNGNANASVSGMKKLPLEREHARMNGYNHT